MNWFVTALKNYAVFSGRSRRSEYWYFGLFYLIFYGAAAVVDVMIGSFERTSGIGVCTAILALALLIPSISVTVRRLHDTGRSGWWILIGFIPLVGGIILLVFLCQDSEPGANRFGGNPKAVSPVRSVAPAGPAKSWSTPQAKR
jgi:uncharacterized membrane protein YhaH (DUF805 family)